MQRLLLFFTVVFVSCSQAFIEETQELVPMDAKITYNTTSTGIELSWTSLEEAKTVQSYRGETLSSMTLYNERLPQNNWLDTDTIPGRDYYYQIKSLNSKNRVIGHTPVVKGYRSYASPDDVKAPVALKATDKEYADRIDLRWAGDSDNRYRIYRAKKEGTKLLEEMTLVEEVSFENSEELIYRDKGLDTATTYEYKVAAVAQDVDGTILEKDSNLATGQTLFAPVGLEASKLSGEHLGAIELTWAEDRDASYFKVYRTAVPPTDPEHDNSYKMVTSFAENSPYIDRNLPIIEGTGQGKNFSYPSYYYKIAMVKNGVDSSLGNMSEGKAIDPRDFLSAPEQFTVTFDKEYYPYSLRVKWQAVQTDKAVEYVLTKKDANNPDAEPVILAPKTAGEEHVLANEAFNTRWIYTVAAVNKDAGDLAGQGTTKSYHSLTPAPPASIDATIQARVLTTNLTTYLETTTNFDKLTWILMNKGKTSMNGYISDEWHVTSEAGFVDLRWKKQYPQEAINFYTIYRRKEGEDGFKKVFSDIPVTEPEEDSEGGSWAISETFRDDFGNDSALLKGEGTGANYESVYYDYVITATFGGEESAPSQVIKGSPLDPAIILPAPAYITVPFNWAHGWGYTFANPGWNGNFYKLDAKDKKSPRGFDQIDSRDGGVNNLVLVWEDMKLGAHASKIDSYLLRMAPGIPVTEDEEDKTGWKVFNNVRYDHQWFSNPSDVANGTGLLDTALEGIVMQYIPQNVTFTVSPLNKNAANIPGDERGIIYRETPTTPAQY